MPDVLQTVEARGIGPFTTLITFTPAAKIATRPDGSLTFIRGVPFKWWCRIEPGSPEVIEHSGSTPDDPATIRLVPRASLTFTCRFHPDIGFGDTLLAPPIKLPRSAAIGRTLVIGSTLVSDASVQAISVIGRNEFLRITAEYVPVI